MEMHSLLELSALFTTAHIVMRKYFIAHASNSADAMK
jgi:hypothetical protein